MVCPRCEDVCGPDSCSGSGKEGRDDDDDDTDTSAYKEDIGDTCFETDLNSIAGFLKGFGIDLG